MSVTKIPLPDSLTTELEADVYRAVKAVQDATPENLTTEIEQQVYRAIVAAGGRRPPPPKPVPGSFNTGSPGVWGGGGGRGGGGGGGAARLALASSGAVLMRITT